MQSGSERKVAILLHGPTAVGKTTVGRLLLGGPDPVLLDTLKSCEELRSDEKVLVLEFRIAVRTDGKMAVDVANAISQIVAAKHPFLRLADVLRGS